VVLCAAGLAVRLVIGGVEQNPGPGVEAESIMQFLCVGYDKSKTRNTVRLVWTLVSQQQWKRYDAGSGEWEVDL
jgi:hypothetical protein